MPHRSLLLLILCTVLLSGCSEGDVALRLRVAATTSADDSGILQELVSAFTAETGIEVSRIIVGSGQALALGERGDVDAVLVHARTREEEFLRAGHGSERRDVMWNEFVVVGPVADPAGVAASDDVLLAFARIQESGALFISRGDDSGTHIRELDIWGQVGGPPTDRDSYLNVGQGMGNSLLVASEKQGYTLVDHGTWLAFRDRVELALLHSGDPRLRNPYGVLSVHPDRGGRADLARRFLEFLVSPTAQAHIRDFRVAGETLFHPAHATP